MISRGIVQRLVALCLVAACTMASAEPDSPPMAAEETATPRNALSQQEVLLRVLKARQFAELNAFLQDQQKHYEDDTNFEWQVAAAFRAFENPDPELTPIFDEWRKAIPHSYPALAASGHHHVALAWAWRGHASVGRTHPARMSKMEEHLAIASGFLTESLSLTAIPLTSLTKLIELQKMIGNRADAEKLLAQAERLDPSCSKPREMFITSLEPRWGGSHQQMDAFAARVASTARDKKTHNLGRWLAVQSIGDQATQRWEGKDLVGALRLFDEAAAKSRQKAFPMSRARILAAVGQTGPALALYEQILNDDPDNKDALYYRAHALFQMRRASEGLDNLRRSARAGLPMAWNDLGNILAEGEHGAPIDDKESLQWMEKAAYFWDPRAAFFLGKTYERGLGVAVNFQKAVRYLRIAADQNHGAALNDLGLLIWYGRGTDQNQDEAIRLWRIAAARGIWQAKHNLNFFLSAGQRIQLGIEDPSLAVQLLGSRNLLAGAGVLVLVAVLVTLITIRRSTRTAGEPKR